MKKKDILISNKKYIPDFRTDSLDRNYHSNTAYDYSHDMVSKPAAAEEGMYAELEKGKHR